MYNFFAVLSRMKLIARWSLMRSTTRENVAEHSLDVAILAHALALIRRDVLGRPAEPDRAAVLALFHDAGEIFTGDLPTPIKYFSPELKSAFTAVEELSSKRLLEMLPESLRPEYGRLLSSATGGTEAELVKVADVLSAHIKCLEELKAGNGEFRRAAEQTRRKLDSLGSEEAEYFIEKFLPGFSLPLDDQTPEALRS